MPATSSRFPTRTMRAGLFAFATVAQVTWFFVFSQRPIQVLSDNVRYEVPGYNLAVGRGLSFSDSELEDHTVRSWACTTSGLGCPGAELYPAAAYPPGYSVFIAGVYSVFGRSLTALWLTHAGLLLLLCAMFFSVAERLLPLSGQFFAAAVLSVYPFIARQMSFIMSDGLHLVLWFAVFWVATALRPGVVRGAILGVLAAAAVLTRPYALVSLPFMLAFPSIRAALCLRAREIVAIGLAGLLLWAPWVIRNELVFGRFIPLSTAGLGLSLLANRIEGEVGTTRLLDADIKQRIEELSFEHGQPLSLDANRKLTEDGWRWIRDNPGTFSKLVLARLPRLWISQGYSGEGLSRYAIILTLTMGMLTALGFVGLWARRRAGHFQLMAVMTVPYWLFLALSPAEARRTLPLRLFMLLGAAALVEPLIVRFTKEAPRSPEGQR